MLDRPQNSHPVLRFFIFLAVVGAVGFGAFRLGDRHGRREAVLWSATQVAALPPPGQASGIAVSGVLPAPALTVVAQAPQAAAVADGVSPAPDAGAVPTEGPFHLMLTLKGSLAESIQADSTVRDGPALTMVVSRMLVWWLNPSRDARPGDKLWVVYETPAGQEPSLLALRFQSQKLGVTKTAVRFKPQGAPFARYYDAAGTEVEARLVNSPLEDWEQITSLLKDGRGHKGVDFKVPIGTPVHAPVDGRITRRNWKVRANGDCLGLEDTKNHREMLFLHLSAIEPNIHVGSQVKAGDVLAKTGNTGHTTAPHLHYQLMGANDRVLDPFEVQETTHRTLPAEELPALHKTLDGLSAQLGPEQQVAR